ncbi:MAG: hypothetical protein AAF950_02940 [Pseudomonadota bacterium]
MIIDTTNQIDETFTVTKRQLKDVLTYSYFSLILLYSAVLILRHGLGYWSAWGLNNRFHMQGEATLPALYSGALIFLCAILLIRISRSSSTEARLKRGYLMLGCIFAFLALDEWIALHELVGLELERNYEFGGIFYYSWVIPYAGLLLLMVAVLASWYIQLPNKERIRYTLAGVVYIAGVMGLEMLSASFIDRSSRSMEYEMYAATLDIIIGFEETFEIVGMSLFALALFDVYTRYSGKLKIRISAG